MQTYIDNGNGTISIDGMTIPKDGSNRHYQEFLQLQAGGEAELVAPIVSLNDAISAKKSAIQNEKCRVRDAGFEVDGVLYDSDQAARIAYLELADSLVADASYATPWKASAGVWVTMTASLFAKVKAAGEVHVAAAFAWQAARDAEVTTIQAAVTAGTMTEADALTAVAAVSAVYTTV